MSLLPLPARDTRGTDGGALVAARGAGMACSAIAPSAAPGRRLAVQPGSATPTAATRTASRRPCHHPSPTRPDCAISSPLPPDTTQAGTPVPSLRRRTPPE
jgi:hypothetical protein